MQIQNSTTTFPSSPVANQLQSKFQKHFPWLFNPKNAVSGNPGVVEILSFNGRQFNDIGIRVSQLATSQRNESNVMPDNLRRMPCGEHTIEITIDGKRHEISFFVPAQATNKEFKQEMERAINRANIGIRATVNTIAKPSGNYSSLSLETAATGAGTNGEPRFTIKDISGNAVALTGIDNIAAEAKNARFTVNGGRVQESATNRINLGNGLRILLTGISGKTITVSHSVNSQAIQLGMQQFAEDLKFLLKSAVHYTEAGRCTAALAQDIELTKMLVR